MAAVGPRSLTWLLPVAGRTAPRGPGSDVLGWFLIPLEKPVPLTQPQHCVGTLKGKRKPNRKRWEGVS